MCGDLVIGTRVVCLSCGTEPPINLCGKELCLGSDVNRKLHDSEDMISPHLPSHDLMKVRTAMLDPNRESGEVYHMARSALEVVHQIFANESTSPSTSGESTQSPTCVECGEQVSQPCWYCVECKGKS